MKYDYIRLLQILIVTIYSLTTHSILPYFSCLIVTALPSYRSFISTMILIISLILTLLYHIVNLNGNANTNTNTNNNNNNNINVENQINEKQKFTNQQIFYVILVIILTTALQFMKFNYSKLKIHKYITPILMFMLSLVSMPQEIFFRNYHLSVFCIFLLLTYYKIPFWLLLTIRVLTLIQGIYLFVVDYCKYEKMSNMMQGVDLNQYIGENPWWHYFAYIGICVTSDIILYGMKFEQIQSSQNGSQKRFQENQIPMIELHQIQSGRQTNSNQNVSNQDNILEQNQNENQSQTESEKQKSKNKKNQRGRPKQSIIKKYIPPHIDSDHQQHQQQKVESSLSVKNSKQKLKQKSIQSQKDKDVNQLSLRKQSSYSLYSQPSNKGNQDGQSNLGLSLSQKALSKSGNIVQSSEFFNKQSEILNLFLLIPFTCFAQKYLEIPLYVYFITLHYSKAHSIIFFTMLLSIFLITFLNYSQESQTSNFILRLCLVFMVDKNFQLAINIADAVRFIWLKNSFAIVLTILFWFGLRTVNIFHMIFIIIILLFITKGSSDDNHRSFRNKNWKYLLGLFNVYLILRFIYQIAIFHYIGIDKISEKGTMPQKENGETIINQNDLLAYLIKQILDLIGISHIYQPYLSLQFFNLIPLIISAVIAIQYWTYTSKIYQTVRQQSLLENSSNQQTFLKILIEKVLNILTMLFYKLVPWFSYALIILTLVAIDFSVISGVLLSYIVFIYIFQVLYPKNSQALYKLWLIFSRLVALQIILRYLFQFAKFQIVYNVLQKLPWFDFLQTYQELFGLMIRQSAHVYLKTITKFQLMIALDFGMIFIAFLMYEYLVIVIKYHELLDQRKAIQNSQKKKKQQLKQHQQSIQMKQMNLKVDRIPQNKKPLIPEDQKYFQNQKRKKEQQDNLLESKHSLEQKQLSNQKVIQIYQKFINFKLTNWLAQHNLQTVLNQSTLWYLKLYLPIIGVFGCIKSSIIMGLYLLLILKFYLTKNTQYYNIFIGSNLATRIRQVAQKWRQKRVRKQAQQLQVQLQNSSFQIDQQQMQTHARYTKWIVILAALGVLLTYFSRLLSTQEISDFIDESSLLQLDWFLYIFGTSKKLNPSMSIFLIIFVLVAIQSKSLGRAKKIQQSQGKSIIRSSQALPQDESICKYIDMQISILFGLTKLVQRAFVMVLIFTSILQDKNPFGVIYLLCAWLLNSIGSSSILSLSRLICILILCEYFLIITNFKNALSYKNTPQQFNKFRQKGLLDDMLPQQWKQYLSFGDSIQQISILLMSFLLLISYQLYFLVAFKNWQRVLQYLCQQLSLTRIVKKLYQYLQKTYSYSLMYSPLCITSLCLALYFMDYTATNLFLSVLSVIFLFKSFLIQNYADSRSFWKSYFLLLQALIIIFMLVYCVLSIPMYQKYCNPILCSSQEFRTKVTKAILLFILQIGVDMMKSHHFNAAMDNLKETMETNSAFSRLAIAYKINDRKIALQFKNMFKRQKLLKDIQEVQNFVDKLKGNPTLNFQNKKQIADSKQSWLDTVLQLLPSILDPALLMTHQQAVNFVRKQNKRWIEQKQLTTFQLSNINETYIKQFQNVEGFEPLQTKLKKYLEKGFENLHPSDKNLISQKIQKIKQKEQKNLQEKQQQEKGQDLRNNFNVKETEKSKQTQNQNQSKNLENEAQEMQVVRQYTPQKKQPSQQKDKIRTKSRTLYQFKNRKFSTDQLQKDKQQRYTNKNANAANIISPNTNSSFHRKFIPPEQSQLILRHNSKNNLSQQEQNNQSNLTRKSFIDDQLPLQPNQIVKNLINNSIRQSFKQDLMRSNPNYLKLQLQSSKIQIDGIQNLPQQQIKRKSSLQIAKKQFEQASFRQQKKNLLYLLLFESILSNWQYITYFLMILQHFRNMGLLTITFPIITFLFGIPHPYQASKNIWRISFISILIPIFFKFIIGIKLLQNTIINKQIQLMLLGDNLNSIIVQYLLVISIIIQCLILKVVGLYDTSVTQVQCMKIALIRNVINTQNPQELQKLYLLLKQQSIQFSSNQIQYIFSKWQIKTGYDYSTMLVTIQLTILFFIFLFYDRMAIRKDLSFYSMIQYNQFTGGMVVLALIQLLFMLMERFIAITNLKGLSNKWQTTLLIKYGILIIGMILIHYLTLIFFPKNAGTFASNVYVQIFYILNALYFLIAALQIKYGIDQLSRGFMQRYTWYNGFVYMFFRAIPFLFQFKIFSDWTVTQTSLRLFDWIKFQQVFGRLYVAKCNSLFMRGKLLGSKIEWWKKLLMGYPLLLIIILLLFGPLILFSALNPLASVNGISGGYVQMTLKVNKTNQYTFFTNSHITDIYYYKQGTGDNDDISNSSVINNETLQIIDSYDLNPNEIQILNLQEYSDQYWEISKGSYQKLLNQPKESLYELSIRIRFERNMTGPTPVYTINTYQIPQQRIDQFKLTLEGGKTMKIDNFVDTFLRLDNNNGLHTLSQTKDSISFRAQLGKSREKKYWIIQKGIAFKIASDKYSKAIFGYSVMSFYISIILVIANYFRFLFQGSAHTIIMSDIPNADPLLRLCQGVYRARIQNDIMRQQKLFWMIIDLVRSPDSVKSLTGNYLDARQQTLIQERLRKQRQNQKEKIKKQ